MLDKEERIQLRKLLADAVPLLCKNSISGYVESQFCVEAMIGITVDEQQVAIICFKETLDVEGRVTSGRYGEEEGASKSVSAAVESNTEENEEYGEDDCQVLESGAEQPLNPVRIKSEPSEYSATPRKRARTSAYDDSNVYGKWHAGGGDSMQSSHYSAHVKQESYNDGESYNAGLDGGGVVKEEQEEEDGEMYGDEWEGTYYEEDQNELGYTEEGSQEYIPHASTGQQGFSGRRGVGRGFTGGAGRARQQNYGRSPGAKGQVRRQSAAAAQSSRFSSSQKVEVDVEMFGNNPGYGSMVKDLCESLVQQSTSEQHFICHICHAQLSSQTTLRNHIRGTHLALKSVRCNICGESFKWGMQLARHKKREHGESGNDLHIYNTGSSIKPEQSTFGHSNDW